MINLKDWIYFKSSYTILKNTGTPTAEELDGREKRKKYLFVTLAFTIFIMLFTALIVVICTTFQLVKASSFFPSKSSSTTNFSSTSDVAPEATIIPFTNGHDLDYNSETRRASKKLYELLTDFDTSYYDDENMILGTIKLTKNVYSRQPYVANGYIGSRIPNTGFGFAYDELNFFSDAPGALNNGWPLRNQRYAGAFVSDFYSLQEKLNSTNFPEIDNIGYSTVLSSIPQWTDLQFSLYNDTIWFNPLEIELDDITNYSQNLSMKDGIVTTEMDWLNNMIHVKSEIWAHRNIHPLGMVTLELSLNVDNLPEGFGQVDINVYDILNFTTSQRTYLKDLGYNENTDNGNGIYMIIEPDNVPYSNAALFSTCSLHSNFTNNNFKFNFTSKEEGYVSQVSQNHLSRDNPKLVIHKYVGIISTEYNTNSENITNIDLATKTATNSKGNYELLKSSHKRAWYALYNDAFIEIPSDALLEMTARSSLYQLLANTRAYNVSSDRGLPIAVSGLSSDSYGGMVFWDADLWIEPAILPFFPQIALNMNNYRNSTHAQAKLNAEQYGFPGAVYPWTSGRYANCTSTGPCIDYEYHINVDIALATFSIYLNGGDGIDDTYLRYTTWPIVRDAAIFFSVYAKYNSTLGVYETYNLTDPDEYANHVNNGAFTNAGIKTLLKWATDIGNHLNEYVDPKWMEISKNILIPRSSSNITLEYSGMNSTVEIKQADVTLMVYPLGYINDESILNNAIKDLYYYSERQSASGPAMTYPVFTAAAAALLNHGSSSQSYLYKSVLPYLRAPFAQFSEQSDDNFLTNGLTQPAFPFLTANGGFLQSILFGLTGIRYSYEVEEDTKNLIRVLKFNPSKLPLLPGGIAIRNFKYMGQTLDIIINDCNGTIVHKSGNESIRIKVPDRQLIRDRDIKVFDRTENALNRRAFDEDAGLSKHATYYTLHPQEEFILQLYTPNLNVEGNLIESKQITNLTAGVPGDVPYSALDGNNFTHWQPINKDFKGKLLIDLGDQNEQEINGGMILWGQRPAKNISISILPHTERIELIFSKVTEILEDPNVLDTKKEIKDFLTSLLENDSPSTAACSNDVLTILNWKNDDFGSIMKQLPDVSSLHENFVTIIDDMEVKPTEPYYHEVMEGTLIELLPSNRTEFKVDYDNVDFNKSVNCFHDISDINGWKKARYIVVSVEGTFDDDDDERGATVKEIVLTS
ncbi:hypothetical protein KAFR_0K02080 [Kazachstania africana CBS 2517]|uniref:alpha,alpha-trehalase n=1 Tax=Kazachstania africana (strain ATCC 22294 / BCRC 22015 / CBS 2517 / CECT 1963 / NBRC 1671 / NRRL Y-8276) TaxID=1071382 RepID=H2B1R2_KAZAF|nr:hypothetical protein KAFR_0K02080 [Kazachstania africana CBS 2517]CCF60562.1 hypothetical protein KAFR_0K02080 [Kazachstania africana CBS 2517]